MSSPKEFRQEVKKIVFPQEARKEKKQELDREYSKSYRKKNRFILSTYTKNETKDYKEICQQAKKLGLPVSVYQKQACLAFGRQKPIIPPILWENMAILTLESIQVNSLVSEWTEKANFLQKTSAKDLKQATKEFRKVTKKLEDLFLFIRDKFGI